MDDKLAGTISIFCVQGWICYVPYDLINETYEALSNPLLKRILLSLKGNIKRNLSYYEQDAKVNDIRLSFSIQSNLPFHKTPFNTFVVQSPINTYVLTPS